MPVRALSGIDPYGPFPLRLYSWTTAEQAAGLRAGDAVFSKTTTDSGHRGLLFDVLEKRAIAGDEKAKLLSGPLFEKGRFGWPFLVGARVSPERYGDSIVAFTLRPEAIFAVFSSKMPVTFIDAKGISVPTPAALAAPERIGAFFFLNDQNTSHSTTGYRCLGTLDVGLVYREFYLGNIDMVEEWSLGTQAVADRLGDEIGDLRSLGRDLDCTSGRIGPSCDIVLAKWASVATTRADRFVRSMAFATPFGRNGISTSDLVRMADDLDGIERSVRPLVVRP